MPKPLGANANNVQGPKGEGSGEADKAKEQRTNFYQNLMQNKPKGTDVKGPPLKTKA